MKPVVVLGIGQSQFGKFPQRTIADLGSEAVRAALADAALERSQLQIAYSSRLYADMITGQTVFKEVGVTRIEMVNVENACAGGATAVRGLWKDIAAGYCDVGIALGVESMTTSPVAGKLIPPAKDDLDGMHGMTMPVMFSLQAKRLMHTHGATREDFAQVSVKAHDFGAVNPMAQYRKRFTVEEVLGSRTVADPITLLQCCPNTDGAAAVILCSEAFAAKHGGRSRNPRIVASVLVSGDYAYKKQDLTSMELGARAAHLAYEQAGLGPEDLDLVELHDAFASEELLSLIHI